MTEYLWLFVVVGGPIILGLIMAYGMMKRRRLTHAEKDARDQKTEKLYHSEN
jgi:hypothetical protein